MFTRMRQLLGMENLHIWCQKCYECVSGGRGKGKHKRKDKTFLAQPAYMMKKQQVPAPNLYIEILTPSQRWCEC